MFAKLLKYDLKAISRFFLITVSILVACCTMSAIAIKVLAGIEASEVATLFDVLAVMVLIVTILAVSAATVGMAIVIYLRFYNNFFTDEGYLTFTLPVSRGQLLRSKTLSAMIYTLAYSLIAIVCVLVVLFVFVESIQKGALAEFAVILKEAKVELLNIISAWWVAAYTFAFIVTVVLSLFFGICLVQFCIAVAAVIAKKARIFIAIVIYYGINMVISIISRIFLGVVLAGFTSDFAEKLSRLSNNGQMFAVLLLIFIVCAFIACISALLYYATRNLLERKLNLA